MPWAWRSYPEYLEFLDARRFDIDVASFVPHAALRVFVMGERAANLEAATEEDVGKITSPRPRTASSVWAMAAHTWA